MRRFAVFLESGFDALATWASSGEPSNRRRHEARKLVKLNTLAVVLVPVFVGYYALLGLVPIALALALAGAVMLSSLFLYRKTGNFARTRDVFLGALFLFLVYATWWFGSIVSPTAFWFAVIPVVAVLLGGATSGCVWLGLAAVALIALVGLGDPEGSSPEAWPIHLYATSLVGMSSAVFLFVLMIDNDRKRTFAQLKEANREINELAQRDSLTGLYNRRYVWEALRKAEEKAGASGLPFSIILADVDNFKQINDKYGHVVGDVVLRDIADAILGVGGVGELCGRYGGEEFLVLREGALTEAATLGAAIRDRVAALTFEHVEGPSQVTLSVGLAQLSPGESFGDAFRRADAALYRAKALGRNRVLSDLDDDVASRVA